MLYFFIFVGKEDKSVNKVELKVLGACDYDVMRVSMWRFDLSCCWSAKRGERLRESSLKNRRPAERSSKRGLVYMSEKIVFLMHRSKR
jgi:hypothetical protein